MNDDYSSGADYFLASSVDTVVNAPYLMQQLNKATSRITATNGAINVNLTNPVLASKSQNSFGNGCQSSYTDSVAKNFLSFDNKMNVNNKSNHSSKQQQQPKPFTEHSIPLEPDQQTNAKQQPNTKGKTTFINNIKKLLKKKNTTRARWNAYF